LMRDKLPLPVLRRKKMGFDIPAHEWMRGPLRAMLTEIVSDGASDHADLFRQNVLQEYVNLHLARRANLGYHLWGLMILFLWTKKWGIHSTTEPRIDRAFPQPAATLS
jgi:asparagine synthase (glutamine-hydrolysing)